MIRKYHNHKLQTTLWHREEEPLNHHEKPGRQIKQSNQLSLPHLLQQGISEPIFYGDLVYKFKPIVGKPNLSDQFKKIVKHYKRVGYNLDAMRQSACLVLNPITVYIYGFLFNCTTVGQASDSMTALTSSFNWWVGV